MGTVKNILFVCTGNVCRSPMAEGLFRDLVKHRSDFQVLSAGVSAGYGQAVSPHAVQVLREFGVHISNCRSQPLTAALVREATFIFAMTRQHLDSIFMLFPEAAEKTFLVREFLDDVDEYQLDILDPIGLGLDAYFDSRDAIKKALPSLLAFIDQSRPPPMNEPGTKLRLALAADHGGVALKRTLHERLSDQGFTVEDFGSFSGESVDYPDYARSVCEEIVAGRADFGFLLCRSGIGMSIAANRYPKIRAALVSTVEEARITRMHNDANVLCLASDHVAPELAEKIAATFLQTPFEGGRHNRRVEKLDQLGRSSLGTSLAEVDPEIAEAIEGEKRRQVENIELIASENFTSRAVMEAQGSVLTNKYAEGLPGKRWYGGCEEVDKVEQLAIDRAKQLFGCEHVNVQPHSGAQANMAVYFASIQPGDRILTMDLSHGGHLTHGHKANFSGRFYEVSHYGVDQTTEQIDYDALAKHALEFRPKMITAGASAYPRLIDFARMREIADSVGAFLFVDMAHIAGLVAAGVHPSPVPHAHFVTSTTHKSMRGPRGGIVMCKGEFAKQIDSQIFPGIQGGPLMHVIAAKAVCFHEALQPGFKEYQRQVTFNAKALAARLTRNGYRIVSGGTDNHLMLVDVRPQNLNGKEAQETLDRAAITVNKNSIPFDTTPIMKGGGIRVGTPAVTTRGMKEEEMMEIADLIHDALMNSSDEVALGKVRQQVRNLTSKYPVPS